MEELNPFPERTMSSPKALFRLCTKYCGARLIISPGIPSPRDYYHNSTCRFIPEVKSINQSTLVPRSTCKRTGWVGGKEKLPKDMRTSNAWSWPCHVNISSRKYQICELLYVSSLDKNQIKLRAKSVTSKYLRYHDIDSVTGKVPP